MSTGSSRAVALALAANGGIAISKFGVFLLTGSSSLLTEAIHSSADCANQVLLFLGMRQGSKPAGPKHPLGHGQAAFVASFLVALLLFSVGGLYSLVEGLHKIRHPEQPHHLLWAVALLVVAIGLEGWSLRGALRAAEPERRGRPLLRYLRQSSSTELVVVVAEDIAALLGLVFAVAAVVGTEVTSLLLNEAPPLALRAAIRAAVDEDPAVDQVLNLVAVIVGSDRLMVALKVKFRDQPSGAALVAAINALERELHQRFPQIQHLFVEPDEA